jgi:hypothetical protein
LNRKMGKDVFKRASEAKKDGNKWRNWEIFSIFISRKRR